MINWGTVKPSSSDEGDNAVGSEALGPSIRNGRRARHRNMSDTTNAIAIHVCRVNVGDDRFGESLWESKTKESGSV